MNAGPSPVVSPSPPRALARPLAPAAASAVEATGPEVGPTASAADQPVLRPEIAALRRRAQVSVLGSSCPALPYAPFAPELPIPAECGATPPAVSCVAAPGALGRFVPIADDRALAPFHRALARLAGDGEPGKVRILVYGASHTQGDLFTGYLRRYLQSRFGDGGQGFVLLGTVNSWYRTLDSTASHRALSVRHARYRERVVDEPLGLLGAAFVGSRAGGYGEVVTAEDSPNTRFEIQYLEQPRGGSFTLSIDEQRVGRVDTRGPQRRLGSYAFEAAAGRRRIRARLEGNGEVRLFGVVAETPGPGIVVDTLGIGGARLSDLRRWDPDLWIEAVRHRRPDLVTFAYGTNEAVGLPFSGRTYERDVREVLARLRVALPDVSCVLLSPFDVRRGQSAGPPDALREVTEVQRRLAQEFGCGFWDGLSFMGGEGSIASWMAATPPLASPDGVHLTRFGYVYAGTAIGDALLRRYDLDPQRPVARPGLVP